MRKVYDKVVYLDPTASKGLSLSIFVEVSRPSLLGAVDKARLSFIFTRVLIKEHLVMLILYNWIELRALLSK